MSWDEEHLMTEEQLQQVASIGRKTGWCPSCTCGWHKELDAFDVPPPESECRNAQCDCHRTFWQSVDTESHTDELMKRYAYGDR